MTVTSNPTPLITVAMVVRNAELTISRAIGSILQQTYPHFELVIIDDGSTDATAARIASFVDPRIKRIVGGASQGLAGRLNEIAAIANGTLIARMDGDDFCYPDRFERQVAFLRLNPDVDLVGTSAMAFSPTNRPLGTFRLPTTHEEICAHPATGFAIPHPTWMSRTTWFQRFPYSQAVRRGQDQLKLLSSYRQSRFANLPEPLLGYRQDKPKISHITQSRLPYLRAIAHDAMRSRDPFLLTRAAIQQLGRTAVGVAALTMGGAEQLLARRFEPATPAELNRFYAVAATLADY